MKPLFEPATCSECGRAFGNDVYPVGPQRGVCAACADAAGDLEMHSCITVNGGFADYLPCDCPREANLHRWQGYEAYSGGHIFECLGCGVQVTRADLWPDCFIDTHPDGTLEVNSMLDEIPLSRQPLEKRP